MAKETPPILYFHKDKNYFKEKIPRQMHDLGFRV